MFKTLVKWLGPLLIVAGALGLATALKQLHTPPAKREKAVLSPVVSVQSVHFAPLKITVSSQGTVTSTRNIDWASEVAGRVVWISPAFVDGGAVAANTLLLRLDDTDYRLAQAEAQAALADARLALAEEQAESRRGAAYRSSAGQAAVDGLRQPKLQQVEANLQAAEAQLNQARKNLAATEVRSPFAGIITGKQADLGQYVATGAVLFGLHSTDIAELRLPITASDIGFLPTRAIDAGEFPVLHLSAVLGSERRQWQGRLVRIEQRIDPQTRTFHAVAQVAQPYDRTRHPVPLPIGLFVDASIEGVTLERGVRIPRAALHEDQYVYVVVDGHLQRRSLSPFRREHESVVVTEGLEDGDLVVTSRLDLMVEGMPVTPAVVEPGHGESLADVQ